MTLLAQNPAPAASAQQSAAAPQELRSLGLFVALERVSKVTEAGLLAIPKGALVTLVETPEGKTLAVFKAKRIPVDNLAFFSKDPALIAAASTSTVASPGTSSSPGSMNSPGPDANTSETIRVDSSGNIISRSKTTVVQDGVGNTTTIMQDSDRAVDAAGKIAMAREKIRQQETAIYEYKSLRYTKQTISGYQSKLAAMEETLSRMKIELARMEAMKKN